jgi:hypothetical protein
MNANTGRVSMLAALSALFSFAGDPPHRGERFHPDAFKGKHKGEARQSVSAKTQEWLIEAADRRQ